MIDPSAFNTMIFLIEVFFLLFTLTWYFFIRFKHKSTNNIYFGAFSGTSEKIKVSAEYKDLLFKKYMSQQVWAYGLLWFTLAISVILGSIMILKVINKQFDRNMIADGIGLAGGVGISISAFRLYRITSQKIEKLLTSGK